MTLPTFFALCALVLAAPHLRPGVAALLAAGFLVAACVATIWLAVSWIVT